MDNDTKYSLAIDVVKAALKIILPPIIEVIFSESRGLPPSGGTTSVDTTKAIDDMFKQLNDSINDSFNN